jgi:hypothetical protein
MELIKELCLYFLDPEDEINYTKYPLLAENDLVDDPLGCCFELVDTLGLIRHPQYHGLSSLIMSGCIGNRTSFEDQRRRIRTLEILSQNPEALIPPDLLE